MDENRMQRAEESGETAKPEETARNGRVEQDGQGEPTGEELERRRLEEENELLRRELEYIKEQNLKERIYDHVHVSVRTMDIFIGIMVVLFFVVIGLGLVNR